MESPFSHSSYKHYLDSRWQNERGLLSRAAEFVPCQRSYLSRVINTKIQLTMDQAFRLCQFFSFSPQEQKYFLLLVDLERSSAAEYRAYLKDQIKILHKEYERQQAKGNKAEISVESTQLKYFMNLHQPALHFLTSIKEFQTVEAIAERMNLSKSLVVAILEDLCQQNLVEKKQDRYVFATGNAYVKSENPLYWAFAGNMRDRAKQDLQVGSSENVHYSVIQTVSEKDLKYLRESFLKTIEEYNRVAGPSNPEELICFNLDFFRY